MAAGSSSGEEAAAGTGPAPQEIQEQAAPTMMAMMALLVEKVGGLQETAARGAVKQTTTFLMQLLL